MTISSNRTWHILFISLTFASCTLAADAKSVQPLSVGEHTVMLNGVKLWYKVSGSGPVCLMPSPAQGYSSLLYVRTLGCMEKLFTMVYLDCRGTGQSGRAQALNQYTWDDLVGDLDALRDHLHQETIWLMGNSSAGHQSLHYACKHPDRVDGVVLLCAYAFAGPESRQLIDKRLARMKGDPRYDDGIKAWHARWAEENRLSTSALSALSDEENEKLSEAYFTLYWSNPRLIKQWEWAFEGDTRSVEGTAGEEASNRDKADLRGELKKVKAPVLIVVGDDDFACGPDVAYYLHLELPKSKLLLIEDAGHFPWLEQPEVFEKRVPEFLHAMGLGLK